MARPFCFWQFLQRPNGNHVVGIPSLKVQTTFSLPLASGQADSFYRLFLNVFFLLTIYILTFTYHSNSNVVTEERDIAYVTEHNSFNSNSPSTNKQLDIRAIIMNKICSTA